MRFAQELNQELVPEWRAKYFDYKTAKNHVKAVARAVSRSNGTTLSKNKVVPESGSRKTKHPPTINKNVDSDPNLNPVAYDSSSKTQTSKNTNSRVMFQLSEPTIVAKPTEQTKQTTDEGRRQILKPLIIPGATEIVEPSDPPLKTVTPSTAETPSERVMRRILPPGYSFARVQTEKLAAVIAPKNILRVRQREFLNFLDAELLKIESFYLEKEAESGKRLAALREQLHIMRDRRAEELEKRGTRSQFGQSFDSKLTTKRPSFPIKSKKMFKSGPDPEATQQLLFTPTSPTTDQSFSREYTKKKQKASKSEEVSYRTASRKLKLALQEYYRGLELLKSYALLNRTAFRKANKKYDKAMNPNTRPDYQYMNDKVNSSVFVTSGLLEEYTEAAEDLYTRYFENGNHKLAVGELRKLTRPRQDRSESAFLNGGMLGVGFTFAIEGVMWAVRLLNDDDATKREQTSFLLQVYAGYFLMLYMFAFFCLNCRIWTANKINYTFIFEFDPKHDLDWRQLAEFPSFFMLLLGVMIWFNFAELGDPEMFLYYPVLLIFITLCLIVMPLPVLRHESRKWFANSHFRLLCAGFFPVEFRDLAMGDMYCSLTYAVSNTALFFCLYAKAWNNPAQCGSRQSRLVGFFVALPPIWRAFQCIRRYVDSKHAFPHLANLAKYIISIATAVALSLYRTSPSQLTFSLFVGLSSINSLYSAIWDIFMDFSLMQSGARLTGLRDTMAFSQPWIYYGMLVLDPVLRFGWIFLAIFSHHIQHSSVVSFVVAMAEVTRRGLWMLIRVENEHCSNIGQAKASRDVPLPYQLEKKTSEDERSSAEILRDEMFSAIEMTTNNQDGHHDQGFSTSTPLIESSHGTLKQRKRADGNGMNRANTIKGFSRMLARAHTEDFQKRKVPNRVDKDGETESEGGLARAPQSGEELDRGSGREVDPIREERFRARRDEED